jgi:hypothetical protein
MPAGVLERDFAMLAIHATIGASPNLTARPWNIAPHGGSNTTGYGTPETWVSYAYFEQGDDPYATFDFVFDITHTFWWDLVVVRGVHPFLPFAGAPPGFGSASSQPLVAIGSRDTWNRTAESIVLAHGVYDASAGIAAPTWTNADMVNLTHHQVGTDGSSWGADSVSGEFAEQSLSLGSYDWAGTQSGHAMAWALRSSGWTPEITVVGSGVGQGSNTDRGVQTFTPFSGGEAQLLPEDLVLFFWLSNDEADDPVTGPEITNSDDPTPDFNDLLDQDQSGTDVTTIRLFGRKLNNNDLALINSDGVTCTAVNTNHSQQVMIIDGFGNVQSVTTLGLDVTGFDATPATTNPDPPSVTLDNPGAVVLGIGQLAGNATQTPPTNYFAVTGTYYVGGVSLTNSSAIRTELPAGAEDPGVWTITSDEAIGFVLWLAETTTPPQFPPGGGPSAGGGRRSGEDVVGNPGDPISNPPIVSTTYQWERSPDGITGWTAIPGATNQNYTPNDGDIGYWLRVCVTYDNGVDDPQTICSAAFGPIVSGAPGLPGEELDEIQPPLGWGAGY